MREIRNLSKQQIHLPGFGILEVSEDLDGRWNLDLTPSFSENHMPNLRIGYKHYFVLAEDLAKSIEEKKEEGF